MNGFEVIYTGGGVWLSFYHVKDGDHVLSYMVDNIVPDDFTCFMDIGEDYEMYGENILFARSKGGDDYEKYKHIHEKLVKNLYKEMW